MQITDNITMMFLDYYYYYIIIADVLHNHQMTNTIINLITENSPIRCPFIICKLIDWVMYSILLHIGLYKISKPSFLTRTVFWRVDAFHLFSYLTAFPVSQQPTMMQLILYRQINWPVMVQTGQWANLGSVNLKTNKKDNIEICFCLSPLFLTCSPKQHRSGNE